MIMVKLCKIHRNTKGVFRLLLCIHTYHNYNYIIYIHIVIQLMFLYMIAPTSCDPSKRRWHQESLLIGVAFQNVQKTLCIGSLGVTDNKNRGEKCKGEILMFFSIQKRYGFRAEPYDLCSQVIFGGLNWGNTMVRLKSMLWKIPPCWTGWSPTTEFPEHWLCDPSPHHRTLPARHRPSGEIWNNMNFDRWYYIDLWIFMTFLPRTFQNQNYLTPILFLALPFKGVEFTSPDVRTAADAKAFAP